MNAHDVDAIVLEDVDASQPAQLFFPRSLIDAENWQPPVLILDDDDAGLVTPVALPWMRPKSGPDRTAEQTCDGLVVPNDAGMLARHVLTPLKPVEDTLQIGFRHVILDVQPFEELANASPMTVQRRATNGRRINTARPDDASDRSLVVMNRPAMGAGQALEDIMKSPGVTARDRSHDPVAENANEQIDREPGLIPSALPSRF